MKKISVLLIICICASCFTFVSCSEKPNSNDGKFTVVCSVFPQYDFCRVISGGLDEIILLQRNGVDMHSYEPVSKDILIVAKADMLVYTGGESDTWVSGMLESAENTDIITVSLFEFADLLPHAGDEHHDHEHDHNHGEGETCTEYDEHVWTSPKNAIKIVWGLCENMCAANPANAEQYRENTRKYTEELAALDEEYKEFFESTSPTLIIADRFPFLYLAHDYGIDYHAAFSGCSSETGASFEVVKSLIDEMNEHSLNVVFDVDNSGSDVAQRVSESCNAEIYTLYSCQSVTQRQLDDGESYLSFMKTNLLTLRRAYSNADT